MGPGAMKCPGASQILEILGRPRIPLADVAALLDGLPAKDRIAAARAIPGALQAPLFEAAMYAAPLAIVDLVPLETPPWTTVRHFGRNSLPFFSIFEKRFCRPAHTVEPRLIGYNHQLMAWATGPGTMVAYDGPDGEVLVDYREIPDRVPDDWPAPRKNDRGMARFVYGNMVDHLRRVSKHVSIGRAFRGDRPMRNWFILCREE